MRHGAVTDVRSTGIMTITKRHYLVAAVISLSPGLAGAQQPPTEPAPAPGAPAPEPPVGTTEDKIAPQPAPAEAQPAPPEDPIKPAEPPKDEKPAVTAKYDGGTKLSTEDGKFELKLSFRTQMRFESNRNLDDENIDPMTGECIRCNQFTNRFYLPRARFQVEGHVFGKANRYKLEFGLGDQGSFAFVKDLFVEKRLPDSPLYVRFGQWKRPFNRAEVVSDFASTFNERSIQNELAGGGRDLGVAVHNEYEKSPEGIGWVVGLFNGFSGGSDRPDLARTITNTCTTSPDGDVTCSGTRPANFPTDFGPAMVARVDYNSPKIKGYSESDVEGGPLRYSVGASYKVDFANFAKQKEESKTDNMSHGLELDAIIKAMGYSLHGGVVMMKLKSADPEFGFFLQPGMMVIPKKAEIAARFAMNTLTVANPMMGADPISRKLMEMRVAFNWFFQGHTWKLATDAGLVKLTGDAPSTDGGDAQVRVMMQLTI